MSGKVDDVRLPFSTVDPVMGDCFSLLWEVSNIHNLSLRDVKLMLENLLARDVAEYGSNHQHSC